MPTRWIRLFLVVVLGLWLLPVASQDDVDPELAQGAYQAALDMIEWAQETQADSIDFDQMKVKTADTNWIQCWLTELPPEIAKLQTVRVLELAECHFDTLPPEIGELTQLEELYLTHVPLKELPPEIGNLKKLRVLDIRYTALTTLPPEIGQLESLEILNANEAQITSVPPEIGNLKNLKTLVLRANPLPTLPQEIGNLTQLDELNLWHIPLTELPTTIGQLKNLRSLSLGYNQLTHLPVEMGQLTALEEWDVYANPLIFPTADILQAGMKPTLSYLRDYEAMILREKITNFVGAIGVFSILALIGLKLRKRRDYQKKKVKPQQI